MSGNWTVHRSDADWETEFRWEPVPDAATFQQHIILKWQITDLSGNGTYRLHYHGHRRDENADIHPIDSVSSEFTVIN